MKILKSMSKHPQNPQEELNKALSSSKAPAITRFILAFLTGATAAAGKTIGLLSLVTTYIKEQGKLRIEHTYIAH